MFFIHIIGSAAVPDCLDHLNERPLRSPHNTKVVPYHYHQPPLPSTSLLSADRFPSYSTQNPDRNWIAIFSTSNLANLQLCFESSGE
ncbi:hypothetical protein GB937_000691 [Aspergillus fischeri]|nr:hypothetical protein GB937_000691 [Aspergillus fischeri]